MSCMAEDMGICMQRGKRMGWVVKVNKQMCNRKWSSIIVSLRYFISIMIVLFYFVNFLCFVGKVYLLTVSFSL